MTTPTRSSGEPAWLRRITRRGYVGGRYRGIIGKLRMAWEEMVIREEIIWYATPATRAEVPQPPGGAVTLTQVTSFAELEQHRARFDDEYYPGYLDSWRPIFDWGEHLVLCLDNGALSGFNWYQLGTSEGAPLFYGRLFDDDARVCRGGVFPSLRAKGLNTRMKWTLLGELFNRGVTRVYADCGRGNIASVRALARVGFKPSALVTVLMIGRRRVFVRWRSCAPILEQLRRDGMPV